MTNSVKKSVSQIAPIRLTKAQNITLQVTRKIVHAMRELGRRLQLVSADHNTFTNLIQRLSVAVQRGNAASVLGSAGVSGLFSDPLTLLLLYTYFSISYVDKFI